MSIAYIDWGGTHFRCVVEGKSRVSYEKASKEVEIEIELQELFERYPEVDRVGISFAGETKDNVIISAPNISAKGIDLNKIFKDKTIIVQNDLKCAILAEAAYLGEQNIAALYIGTGIGSAYMDNKRVVSGCGNLAGEIGHIPYKERGVTCGCGKTNCLELTASGSGIAKMAQLVGIDAKRVDELLKIKEGEEIISDFVYGVGYAASLIVTMLNPKILVIGGGIAIHNDWIVEKIRGYVSKNSFPKSAKMCEIKLSSLQNGSLEGAKILVS